MIASATQKMMKQKDERLYKCHGILRSYFLLSILYSYLNKLGFFQASFHLR